MSENHSPNRQLRWHDCCKSYYHKSTCPASPLFALPNLAAKYGPDWEAKMELYKTAKHNGEHVALVHYDRARRQFIVRAAGRPADLRIVDIYELDNFVL